MKKILGLVFFMSSLLFASGIEIKNPYARATPAGVNNSAAFMSVENDTNMDISIIKASSKVSKAVELHTMSMKNGIMKMYQVPEIKVPAHGKIVLKPGGFHIMLIGLYKPLKVGQNITLALEFSNKQTKTITAPVKTVMSGMKKMKAMGMKGIQDNCCTKNGAMKFDK